MSGIYSFTSSSLLIILRRIINKMRDRFQLEMMTASTCEASLWVTAVKALNVPNKWDSDELNGLLLSRVMSSPSSLTHITFDQINSANGRSYKTLTFSPQWNDPTNWTRYNNFLLGQFNMCFSAFLRARQHNIWSSAIEFRGYKRFCSVIRANELVVCVW